MANKYLDSTGLTYLWSKIKALVPATYAGSATAGGTANKTASIPYAQVDSTSTSKKFTATVDGITELRDGVCMYLRNQVVTSASGFTINVNSLGAKPVYQSMAASTAVTTTFNINYTMLFIYNSTRVSGGCWDMYYGYYTNTTMAYGHLDYYFRAYAGETIYRYKLVMQGEDNRLYPITTTNQADATQVAKTPTTVGLRPGRVWLYNTTTTISAGSVIGAQTLQAAGYTTGSGYTFNENVPTYMMVYLRGTYNKTKGLFYLYNDGTSPCTSFYTYVPTNTANIDLSSYFVQGYYYLLVGGSYSTANYMSVFGMNELMYFDGTNLVPVSTKLINDVESSIPTKVSDLTNDSGFVTQTWVESNTPSNTSDLTNDSGFVTQTWVESNMPTKVSDLTNDSNYATQTWVQNYLAGKVTQDANGYIVLDDSE